MIETSVVESELAEKKINKTGLYITAAESRGWWRSVTTSRWSTCESPAETMLVGHPTAADTNIPFKMIDPEYPFNAEKGRYKMMNNPNFIR